MALLSKLTDALPERPNEPLFLPQTDPDPSRRAHLLTRAQDHYGYSYRKPNVRGIAMCEKVPPAEVPTPGWLLETAKALGAIAANSAALAIEEAAEARDDRHGEFHRSLKSAGQDGARAAIDALEAFKRPESAHRDARQRSDFARLFQTFRVPDVATEIDEDETFARLRLAGSNPAWIRQVDPQVGLPSDFGVTEAHYGDAMGSADTLTAAQAAGRLFLCEYRELMDLTPGCAPPPGKLEVKYDPEHPEAWDAAYAAREASYADGDTPKSLAAPLALFVVPAGGGPLRPVAIQLNPNGYQGRTWPVFTPRDGAAWSAAKACVQSADGNVHEGISHLGLTHLVQEAFALATHNCLSPRHPLNRLLEPHFQGTLLINAAADATLVAPSGTVDKILGPTIGSVIKITAAARAAWRFNDAIFPRSLELRGVADRATLPDYPFRDDGLLVWRALEAWVDAYVGHYYASDTDVVADPELQAFVAQAAAYDTTDARGRTVGGGVNGLGEDGPCVRTRSYLVQMLTQIIWNGSAQHAAVNFPQADLMSYAGAFPSYVRGPLPDGGAWTDADGLAMHPDLETANDLASATILLGAVHDTKLGHYGRRGLARWFEDKTIRAHLEAFQATLVDIEATIHERNHSRPRYTHLLPSLIPQSIDI
jgi:arachidonate 15-lipoxygenase